MHNEVWGYMEIFPLNFYQIQHRSLFMRFPARNSELYNVYSFEHQEHPSQMLSRYQKFSEIPSF